jgi:hypothetical protein
MFGDSPNSPGTALQPFEPELIMDLTKELELLRQEIHSSTDNRRI